jgi:sRNA-binding protein
MKTTDKNTTFESNINESSDSITIEKLLNSTKDEVSSTDALKVLRYFWPAIFNISSPQPLKIGIHKDIFVAENIPEWLISKALQFFTSRDEYLKQIKHGTKRINLHGKPSGTIRLKEVVDAETKRYYQSSSYKPQRRTFLVTKSKLLSIDNSLVNKNTQ